MSLGFDASGVTTKAAEPADLQRLAGEQPSAGQRTSPAPRALNGQQAAQRAPAAAGPQATVDPRPATGPIDLVMSTVIRKLSWSRLADPKVALSLSAAGLLLGTIVGATAWNMETLPLRLPLSRILPPLNHSIIAPVMLYTGNVLACLGLAGMLWAHSQGWRPDPR